MKKLNMTELKEIIKKAGPVIGKLAFTSITLKLIIELIRKAKVKKQYKELCTEVLEYIEWDEAYHNTIFAILESGFSKKQKLTLIENLKLCEKTSYYEHATKIINDEEFSFRDKVWMFKIWLNNEKEDC